MFRLPPFPLLIHQVFIIFFVPNLLSSPFLCCSVRTNDDLFPFFCGLLVELNPSRRDRCGRVELLDTSTLVLDPEPGRHNSVPCPGAEREPIPLGFVALKEAVIGGHVEVNGCASLMFIDEWRPIDGTNAEQMKVEFRETSSVAFLSTSVHRPSSLIAIGVSELRQRGGKWECQENVHDVTAGNFQNVCVSVLSLFLFLLHSIFFSLPSFLPSILSSIYPFTHRFKHSFYHSSIHFFIHRFVHAFAQ